MPKLTLDRWERQFCEEALSDNVKLFRDHLKMLEIDADPREMMAGTVIAVTVGCSYYNIDGRPLAPFLEMQTYDPAKAPEGVKYIFTFEGYRSIARILLPSKIGMIDLADLLMCPLTSYFRIWVTRTDEDYLSPDDLAHLEREITYDLRFDYSEKELDLGFDGSYGDRLWVGVCENDEDDEDVE